MANLKKDVVIDDAFLAHHVLLGALAWFGLVGIGVQYMLIIATLSGV